MCALVTFFAGVVFGLALAAPPGPMNAVIAEESVLRGWLAGVTAGLGAMTADACFLGLALLGTVAVIERLPVVRAVMVGVGGLLMWYFAYGAAREANALVAVESADEPAPVGETGVDDVARTAARTAARTGGNSEPRLGSSARGFWKALVLALTNPYQILFWLTIGVGLLESGSVDVLARTPYVGPALGDVLIVETGTPALVLGLFGGIGVWVAGFPAALVAAQRRVKRLAPAVAYLSAIVLAGFGAVFLLDAVRTLLYGN